MSRAELRAGVAAFAAFVLNPPGWIPAWVTLAFVIVTGWALQVAALHSSIEIARLQEAFKVYDKTSSTYVATLSIWLGYRGVGGIVEAFRAVLELRAAPARPPGAPTV